jgi:alkylated DNA repair dioxygenase AlkB
LDGLILNNNQHTEIPPALDEAYQALRLPFGVRPGGFAVSQHLNLTTLLEQVHFQVDYIQTKDGAYVQERRPTQWQGDKGVDAFYYSGKCMPRQAWSPCVVETRDRLRAATGIYYDCCLLNLYPRGSSAMNFHSDPDQGTLWGLHQAIVSVGATRKFVVRSLTNQNELHSFYVLDSDVTEMFGDCQNRYEHAIKKADVSEEDAVRSSLVFKQTLKGSRANEPPRL